jgi:hypothetical protein
LGGKVHVNTTSGNVSNVTIALSKATALFYGTVLDNLGHPLPGTLQIEAEDQNDSVYKADGYSDANGNYVAAALGGLGSGDPSQVQIESSGFSSSYNFSQPAFDENGGTNINVGQAVLADFTATLAAYTISGTLKDDNGDPITGVDIYANTTNNSDNINVDTDSNGFYSMNVTSDTWSVGVNSCSDCGSGSLPTNYFAPANQTVVVSNSNVTVNFTALPAATNTISGTLTDGNGKPIADVSIYASTSNNVYNLNATTDSNGNYSMSVINGTWSVGVNSCTDCGSGALPANYLSPTNQNQTVVIDNDSAVVNFVAIAAPYTISGTLEDGNGNPIAGVNIYANTTDNVYNQNVTTDNNGFYSMSVINETWSVGVNSCNDCGSGSLPGNYLDPANQTVVISNANAVVNFIAYADTGSIITVSGPLDFGVVPLGGSSNLTFMINNPGSAALNVSSINFPNAEFNGNWSGGQIPPGNSQQVMVTFSPMSPTNYSGMMTITSDAASGSGNLFITAFGANTNSLLTILINGGGKVTPNPTRPINPGTKVTLRAIPGKTNVFSNWTGSINSTNNPLTFNMADSTILQANFIPNPFLPVKGNYRGLFAPANSNRQQNNSGSFTFALTSGGAISGDLASSGQTAPFSGKFGLNGAAEIVTKAGHGVPSLTIALQLDFANQSVSGTLSDSDFAAAMSGYHDVLTNSPQAAAIAGRYTFVIPGADNPDTGPFGTSVGTVKVSGSGAVALSGSLADGTTISQSTVVS